MSAVVFLLLALVIIVVGSVAVYLRQRTPGSLESGIDSFRREMEALAVRHDNGVGHGLASGNGRSRSAVPAGEPEKSGASEVSGPPGPSPGKG